MVRNGWASGPGREGVGGEARVDDRQLGLEALVGEVRVERLQLGRGQHALVDDGPRGQRREVHAELVLGTLADAPGPGVKLVAVQLLAGGGGEERLGEVRHAGAGHGNRRGRPPRALHASRGR